MPYNCDNIPANPGLKLQAKALDKLVADSFSNSPRLLKIGGNRRENADKSKLQVMSNNYGQKFKDLVAKSCRKSVSNLILR